MHQTSPVNHTRLLQLLLAAVLLALLIPGCRTSYHKSFVVGGVPRYPNEVIEWHGFTSGIKLNAFPTDEQSYRDSSYTLWISAHNVPDCTGDWPAFFQSLNLDSLVLRYDSVALIPELTDMEIVHRCDKQWNYKDVFLPDQVDTVQMHLHFSYVEDSVRQPLDTVVTLFRIQAKYREMMSW